MAWCPNAARPHVLRFIIAEIDSVHSVLTAGNLTRPINHSNAPPAGNRLSGAGRNTAKPRMSAFGQSVIFGPLPDVCLSRDSGGIADILETFVWGHADSRTAANLPCSTTSSARASIGHRDAQRFRSLQVDDEFVPCQCLHGQIGWLFSPQDAVDIAGGQAIPYQLMSASLQVRPKCCIAAK